MQQPESSCRDCCRIRSSPFQTERSSPSPAQYGRVRPGPTLTNPTPSNHPGAKAEPETSPGRSSYPTIPTSHFRTYRTAFPLPHTCALLYAALALSLHRVAHKLYAWPAFFQEAQQPQSSSLSTQTIHSTPHSNCTGSDSAARAVQSQIDTTCGRARFGDTGYDVGIACKKAGRPPFAAFPSFNAGSPDAPPHTHHRPPIPYPYTESTVPRTKRTPYTFAFLFCAHRRALGLLMLVGVANSSMNPDPEPVNGGPIQVFIMAGQPACVEVPCLYGDTSHQPSFLGLTLTACSRLAALTCSGRAARRAQWAHTKHVADFEPNNTQASPTWRDTASWQGKKSGRLGSNQCIGAPE